MKNKIILIEGTSNSGKTTLCNNLAKYMNFKVIPEGIRYLERRLGASGDNILSVPNNLEQELNNQEILFDLEFERIFDANFLVTHGNNVVIDKSAYSIVATAYAFENGEIMGNYAVSQNHLRLLLEKIERFNLRMPDMYILLKSNIAISQDRNKNRVHQLKDIWIDSVIQQKQEEILEQELRKIEGSKLILDTTLLSPTKVYEKIRNEISLL